MGVFDNSTKVGRKVKDPGTDKQLSGGGSLSYGGIAGTGGLAGCTGIDCILVHGDRWEEIDGNVTGMYMQNVTETIFQNWSFTVLGTVNMTVIQGWTETQVGPVNRTYVQIVNDTFLMDHNVSVPASAAFQVSMFSNTLTIAEQVGICIGPQVAISGTICLTIAAVIDLEYKTLHAEFHPFHGDGKVVELYAVEAKVKLHGEEAEVGAKTNVQARVNAGVHVEPPAPVG